MWSWEQYLVSTNSQISESIYFLGNLLLTGSMLHIKHSEHSYMYNIQNDVCVVTALNLNNILTLT